MWPWEHVAAGYLVYSLLSHASRRGAPGDRAALVVVLAALLPDLVDKPLSWALGVFPQGYAVGHSLVVFAAIGGLGALLAARGRPRVGAAAVVGHGSHLLGDVLYPALLGEGLAVQRVLWPLVTLPPYDQQLGLLSRSLLYLHRALEHGLEGGLVVVLALEVAFLALVAALWVSDGTPGLRWPLGGSTAGSVEPAKGQD